MKTASIIVSSHNRLPLFRRTLWSIANRPPSIPFEVVVVDDGSTEDILGELKRYSAQFPWTFVRFDAAAFERVTGLKKFHNNPAVTNNLACKRFSSGELIFQQGNEVIAWGLAYDQLIEEAKQLSCQFDFWSIASTTYDLGPQILDSLDEYGSNLTARHVRLSLHQPLQTPQFMTNVTNYLCLTPAKLWYALRGYDERYYAGISAEDSDFIRRARALPSFRYQVSDEAISLHQYHRGKTWFYDPPAEVITKERWDEGVRINHAVYDAWDGTPDNRQPWPWGEYGIGEIIKNGSL